MKSFWRKAGFGLLGVIVLLALFVLIEHERGRRALARGIAELRAKGEKLTVAELIPPRPPEDENGAPAFLGAASRLGAVSLKPSEIPASWSIVVPGKVRLATERKAWDKNNPSGLGKNSGQPQTITMEDLTLAIDAMQPDLEQIHAALRKAALHFEIQYSLLKGLLPHLAKCKSASSWLRAASLAALHRGDVESSLASLEAIAQLAGRQTEEPMEISQLVAVAEAQIGLGATWEALQSAGWTDETLARLQVAWTSRNYLEQMAKAMEMERAMGREFFENASDSDVQAFLDISASLDPADALLTVPTNLDESMDFLPSIVRVTVQGLARRLYIPLWRVAWADQDQLRFLRRWQVSIEATRLAAARHSWQEGLRHLPAEAADHAPMNPYDQCRFLISRQFCGWERRMKLKVAQAETVRSLTVAAIAVKRHQLRHGKLPPSLSALVPEFLPAIPLDEMDGQPLRYRLKADGHFLLYSVGNDGVDDGGDASMPKKDDRVNFLNGRDVVWPEPATAEEIAEAEARVNPRSSR